MIRNDLGNKTVERLEQEPSMIPNPAFNPGKHANLESEVKPFEIVNPGWSIEGVCRVNKDGETMYELNHNIICYREIKGAEHLDPPNPQSRARPLPRTDEVSLRHF